MRGRPSRAVAKRRVPPRCHQLLPEKLFRHASSTIIGLSSALTPRHTLSASNYNTSRKPGHYIRALHASLSLSHPPPQQRQRCGAACISCYTLPPAVLPFPAGLFSFFPRRGSPTVPAPPHISGLLVRPLLSRCRHFRGDLVQGGRSALEIAVSVCV